MVRTGARVTSIAHTAKGWAVEGEEFDAVVWATASSVAAQVLSASADSMPPALAAALHQWAESAQALQYEAIATVYAYAAQVRLAQPMLALHSSTEHPAQFVFDRGQLGGPAGLLAFVVSASTAERELVQSRVLAQAKQQLGITVQALQTVVEKRATFACTPALQRPVAQIAPGLVACGDYVAGPYPATLEGAVRSGIQAVQAL
jgi:predicted NAD/FAD-dependent oxidoreductase